MSGFPLKIVTPEGIRFDGTARMLLVRTVAGDMAVLSGHADVVASLGTGQAVVSEGEHRRKATCSGGMLSVIDGEAVVAAKAFRWHEREKGPKSGA